MTALLPDARPDLAVAPPELVQVPRRPRDRRAEDVLTLVGAYVGGLALVWLLFERLLPLSGIVGFWVCWYAVSTALYVLLVVQQWGWREVSDRLASVLVSTAGLAVCGAIVLVIGYTALRGYHALRPGFFTDTMATTGPLDPLSKGGVLHAVVGSLEQIGIALAFCIPLGIAAALFLNEVGGRLARPVRMLVDAMSAIPSIVAGLFVLATVVLTLGVQRCGFAASLAIAVEMLPVVTRASEMVFRLVPGGLREASLALGATQWKTVRHVVLPTARAGLATTVVLGIARGIGETAPVLLVSGFTSDMNRNPFSGAQLSLPLYILTYVKYPQPVMITRAYGAALALLIVVLVLFVSARILGGNGPGQLSRRQRRRMERSR